MYQAADTRYDGMTYNRCGSSGLRLPAVSLGFWHNFGSTGVYETMRKLCFTAFDNGVTHFDLANNYGPEPGSAEENLGRIVKENFMPYRDELIISTKAGYEMWNGPYGNWGSRKYLLASLDQSLTRLGLPYVDIFYHHRMDPETPLEETMGALDQAVKSGKALYAGLSNYNGQKMQEAAAILRDLKCPFVINQNRYSIFDRTIENNGLKEAAVKEKKGLIAIQPACTGNLNRPLSVRHPSRQPRHDRRQISQKRPAHRRKNQPDPRPQRDGRTERRKTLPDGAQMGHEGSCGNQRSHRCVQTGADIR